MLDKLFDIFPLQLVFRGLFPGGFFVVSYLVASEGWGCVATNLSANPLLCVGSAVFAGVVVYTLHRAVVYPPIELLMTATQKWRREAEGHKAFFRLITVESCQQLVDCWTIGACESEPENRRDVIIGHHLTVWNEYVHMQYVATVCIALGAVCGGNLPDKIGNQVIDVPLITMAGLFAVGALVGDLRRRTLIDCFLREQIAIPRRYFGKAMCNDQ